MPYSSVVIFVKTFAFVLTPGRAGCSCRFKDEVGISIEEEEAQAQKWYLDPKQAFRVRK